MTSSEAKKALAEAISHHQAGRIAAAEPLYRAVITRQPRNADALNFLGVLLKQTGRRAEALELLRRSVELNPLAAHYQTNLSDALRWAGDANGALESGRVAVRLSPNEAEGHYAVGMALRELGDIPGGVAALETAVRLRPAHLPALSSLAYSLVWMRRFDESEALLRRGLAMAPQHAELHNTLGYLRESQGRLDEALASFGRALQLVPDYSSASGNMGRIHVAMGLLEEGIAAYSRAVDMRPDFHHAASNALMAMNYSERIASAELYKAHDAWARRFAEPAGRPAVHHTNDRDVSRPIRVGYVSADLRAHSVAIFLEPLISAHDPAAVHVVCYSNVQFSDEVTERFRGWAHEWRHIAGLPDAAAAELIRRDRIDILVDLSGHTRGNRLLLFAQRPAPVQISYLGWQNTTGLKSIDYRLTDSLVDPPGAADPCHSEKLIRLPTPFAVYSAPARSPDVAPLPALACGHVTFGSFAKIEKIGPTILRRWADAMQRVHGSRLFLLAAGLQTASLRQRMLGALADAGVTADRVELASEVSFADYLALHSKVDLILDTLPFNGHTTTCHGLWMGVPTLTLAGDRYASRMGLSVMTHLGLGQFVARSPAEFVENAVRLASDLKALAELRQGLRERLRASPLMAREPLARAVEAAYRAVWATWCAGPE